MKPTEHPHPTRNRARRVPALIVALLLPLVAVACKDNGTGSGPSIEIAETGVVLPSDTLQLAATVVNADPNQDQTVVWTSSNASVMTVAPNGFAVANAPGVVTITASAVGTSASLELTVIESKISENAVVADSGLVLTSDSTSIGSSNTLEFQNNGNVQVAVGDVLVGSAADGFVRRVVGVSSSGSTLSVTTEDADLTDAVEELAMDVVNDFSVAEAIEAYQNQILLEGPSAMPAGMTFVQGANGQQQLGFSFNETAPLGSGARARITASGSFDMLFGGRARAGAESFRINGKIKGFSIKRFRVSTTARMVFNAGVTAAVEPTVLDGTFVGTRTTTIPNRNAPKLVLTKKPGGKPGATCTSIGIVPVCYKVTLSLESSVQLIAKGFGSINSNVTIDRGAELGGRYRDGSWSAIYDPFGPGVTFTTTILESPELTARLNVTPTITILFYDLLGPNLGLQAFMEGTGSVTPWLLSTNADIGLDAVIGLSARGIGSIPGASYNFELWRATVAQVQTPLARFELQPNPLTLQTGTSANATLNAFSLADGRQIDAPSNDMLRWQTAQGGIATVDGSGRVTGVSQGSTQVGVSLEAYTALNAVANVQVTDQRLLTLGTPGGFRIPHVVGVTGCPTLIGRQRITNTTNQSVGWRVSDFGDRTLTDIQFPWAGTLAPGQSYELVVTFNCASATSVNSTIELQAWPTSNTSAVQTFNFPVRVDVSFPPQ